MDALTQDWCEEQGFKHMPWPPMEELDLKEDHEQWLKREKAWRQRGYEVFKRWFPTEEAYRKWVKEEDYSYAYVVLNTEYEAHWDGWRDRIQEAVKEGVLAWKPYEGDEELGGLETKSWFDYLSANGLARDNYLLGRYLYQSRYYVAEANEVGQWHQVTNDMREWVVSLSSERAFFKTKDVKRSAWLWGEQFKDFLQDTVEGINEQLKTDAVRCEVVRRLSEKHFDGESLTPPYLLAKGQRLQELLHVVVEGMTNVLKKPWLEEHQVSTPEAQMADEDDVQRWSRFLEQEALLAMHDWAGEEAYVRRIIERRNRESR